MSAPVEVWRGGVNAWECDDNGHLNTRFYVQRATEGLAMLFARASLPGLFAPASPGTAMIREMHIRFHREARLSAPLRMTGGFVTRDATRAQVLLVMEETLTAEVKATFRIDLEHADSRDGITPRPWPDSLRADPVPVPDIALPRATGDGPVVSQAGAAAARRLGLTPICAGAIGAAQVDAFGRMAAQGFIGAVSDGIRSLSAPMRALVARHAGLPLDRLGGAVVEFRVLHLGWPRAGDTFEIASGLSGIEGHAKSLIHWMFDPVSGQVWGAMQSMALDFDLDRRAMIRLTPEARAELLTLAIPDLTL